MSAPQRSADDGLINRALKRFERSVVVVLIVALALVLVLAVVDLGVLLYRDATSAVGILGVEQLLDVFGLFLLIVVGLELLETLKAYLTEGVVHVEVVLMAALVAVARKVLLLDLKQLSGLTVIGLAAVLIALATAYRYVKQLHAGSGRGGEDGR